MAPVIPAALKYGYIHVSGRFIRWATAHRYSMNEIDGFWRTLFSDYDGNRTTTPRSYIGKYYFVNMRQSHCGTNCLQKHEQLSTVNHIFFRKRFRRVIVSGEKRRGFEG